MLYTCVGTYLSLTSDKHRAPSDPGSSAVEPPTPRYRSVMRGNVHDIEFILYRDVVLHMLLALAATKVHDPQVRTTDQTVVLSVASSHAQGDDVGP